MLKFQKEKQTEQRWTVKAKCESCELVSHFRKQAGVKISDRACLKCEGPVKATTWNLQGFLHVYAPDLTVKLLS